MRVQREWGPSRLASRRFRRFNVALDIGARETQLATHAIRRKLADFASEYTVLRPTPSNADTSSTCNASSSRTKAPFLSKLFSIIDYSEQEIIRKKKRRPEDRLSFDMKWMVARQSRLSSRNLIHNRNRPGKALVMQGD